MTGLSRLLSVIWLVMRLRFRFSLERSLSNTSPERKAETRSSNYPPSSLFSFAFLIFRSLSRCSLSCRWKATVQRRVKTRLYFVFSGDGHWTRRRFSHAMLVKLPTPWLSQVGACYVRGLTVDKEQ